MGLITLVVVLLVLAVAIWAIQAYLPGDQVMKNLACFVLVVIGLLYILSAFLGGPMPALR